MARKSKPERAPFKAERIPCEIWLQIIESSDFTQSDTASLSQVSKFVRLIAMPMLFKTISLTVTLVKQDATASLPGQSIDYHERLKTRLTFAALPSIAHAVKFVCIRHNGQRLDLNKDDMATPDQLIDTLFQYLHHFPNVRSFSAQKTTLKGQHFDELARLRHLNGMHFDRCSGTGELGLDRFHLKYLSLDGNITGRFGWWIPLLQSSTLYHVSYGAPPGHATEKLFLPALATAPRMTSLQVMRLPALSQTSPCYATALRQCPFVEDLLINGSRTSPAIALPPELLPRLKAVCGPLSFVTMALLGRPLKHITITDCQLAFDSTQSLVQLHVLFPSVEELALPSIWMRQYHPLSLLHGLLAKLPQLRGLYVRMYGSSKTAAEQVLPYLSSKASPPSSLRSLHVTYTTQARGVLGYSPDKAHTPEHPMEGTGVLRHLRKQCPHLVDVQIHVGQTSIVWHDLYTRPVKWYEWDARGGRTLLPELHTP